MREPWHRGPRHPHSEHLFHAEHLGAVGLTLNMCQSPRPWPHPRPAGSISPLDCGVWGTQTHSIERTFLPLISLARLVLIDWAGRPGFSDAVSC